MPSRALGELCDGGDNLQVAGRRLHVLSATCGRISCSQGDKPEQADQQSEEQPCSSGEDRGLLLRTGDRHSRWIDHMRRNLRLLRGQRLIGLREVLLHLVVLGLRCTDCGGQRGVLWIWCRGGSGRWMRLHVRELCRLCLQQRGVRGLETRLVVVEHRLLSRAPQRLDVLEVLVDDGAQLLRRENRISARHCDSQDLWTGSPGGHRRAERVGYLVRRGGRVRLRADVVGHRSALRGLDEEVLCGEQLRQKRLRL